MIVTADGLSARRGDDLLFFNVSFTLTEGQALILTGRNGSGKSTLLRVAAGLLRAESGTAFFYGAAGGEAVPLREASHYLGHRNAMRAELTVRENLSFWKSFLFSERFATGLSVEEAAEQIGLEGILHLPYGYLSAGQQRRFAFAKLLVAHRPVWMLDEPTAALDAKAEQSFVDIISRHQQAGGMVLAATHQPLSLAHATEMQMTGFSSVEQGIWE